MEAGIDYWAFCWYADGDYLSKARHFYLQSRVKDKVKCCAIIGMSGKLDIDTLVEAMKSEDYQHVVSGRPLVYAGGWGGAPPAVVAKLRSRCADQHLPPPYVVAMQWSGKGSADLCDTLGADAIGSYASPFEAKVEVPYQEFAASERAQWNNWAQTGKQVIPFVTVGMDPRPRLESKTPYPFALPYSGGGHTLSTGPELAAQLEACID